MLILRIEDEEFFDSKEQKFFKVGKIDLKMEHSLFSIAKWESIWEEPFLPNMFMPEKTPRQLRSYAECMIIGPTPAEFVMDLVWSNYRDAITHYINKKHTATTIQRFNQNANRPVTKIITAEVIYYQMISFGIPVEFDKWHFNRLLALLEVFIAKTSNKKLSPRDAAAQRQALNEQRRAAMAKGR